MEGISEIQTSTAGSIMEIEDIREVIHDVDSTSGDISNSSLDLQENAVKLAGLAEILQQLIAYFKLKNQR